jgi:hypothetical protein
MAKKKAARKKSPISTMAVGEETVFTTLQVGEETTGIVGENHPTTLVMGEEATQIAGEGTTLHYGEEHLTTWRYGEEGVIHTTLAYGEEGHVGPVSDLVAELLPNWGDVVDPDPTFKATTAAARVKGVAARKRRR